MTRRTSSKLTSLRQRLQLLLDATRKPCTTIVHGDFPQSMIDLGRATTLIEEVLDSPQRSRNVSYPIHLDEYTEKQLEAELSRRARLKKEGKCDYCERKYETPSCKFPDRHRKPK